jgi:glycosyltransferase involved in cell wall biosynthesis
VSVPKPSPLRVAYLVNLYPKTSHSFVRREILALEELGVEVDRYSIRRVDEPLVDPADRREDERTSVLLGAGAARLLGVAVSTALRRPLRTLRALRMVFAMARASQRGAHRVLAWFVEACWLRQLLAARGTQHLHAHFGTNSAAVAMLCHVLGGPTWSFTAHGTETYAAPAEVSLTLKLRHASFAVAIAEWGRRQLQTWAPADRREAMHVVRCGVDERFLREPRSPIPVEPRLLCIARISPEKGIDVLVDAILLLHASGLQFTVALVGDGPSRDELQQRLRDGGAADRLELLGWGDGDRVCRELHRARALVLPSRGEGLPVVLMEAMALFRPAVATDVGAVAELVHDGETGWLVAPGDPAALADAMRAAVTAAPAELSRRGERGRQLVERLHDSRREAARLLELFKTAATGAQRTR